MNQKYQCHICMETAEKPVVTPCGHLFCWVCIYHWLRSNQQYLSCPICKSGLQISMLRPILLPKQPLEKAENGIPPRPRPLRKLKLSKQNHNKIPKSILDVGMNMYRGVLLAGYGLVPSLSMMMFQKHKKPLRNESSFGQSIEPKIYEYLEMGNFIFIILLIIFLLLL